MYNKYLPPFPLKILRHTPFSVSIDRVTFILCSIYLATPNLIFASGYLGIFPALISIISLLFGYFFIIKNFLQTKSFPLPSRQEHLWILFWSLTITIVSGAGALLPQAWDYYKHNSILEILASRPWPVMLFSGKPLVYYTGYYFLPACLAKISGLGTLNFYAFCWQFSGIYLIFRLVKCAFGEFKWYIPLCMLAVFPIDIFYAIIKFGLIESRCYISNPHLYDLFFHFDAMARAVRWVPQHFIPAFIVTMIILNPYARKYSIFWLMQTIIFSPFVAVGLFFIVSFNYLRLLYSGHSKKIFNFINLVCSTLPAIPVILYLFPAKTSNNVAISGLIFKYMNSTELWLNYFAFFTNVFLIWYLLFIPDFFNNSKNKGFVWSFSFWNLIFVLILMLFRMGQFDFPARTLIPAYILLMLWVIKCFLHSHGIRRVIIIIWFSLGLFCGAYDYCCMIKGMLLHPQNKFYLNDKNFFDSGLHSEQYIDSEQKLFYRFFSKNGNFFNF